MNIGIVLFDQFTDLDFYLPWDLLNRVCLLNLSQDWQVFILGDQPQFKSAAGLWVQTHKPYAFAASSESEARVVFKTDKLELAEKLLKGQNPEIHDDDLPQLYW